MSSAPSRRTYGRSPARAWGEAYTDPKRGHGGGLSGATKVSSKGDCSEDVWVLTGGVVPLAWRFSGDSVLALETSVILISPVWEKIIVGWTMELISPSETSCIISSLLVCHTRSGVLADIKGKFLVNSAYSWSPPLPPTLAADVKSLSGSAGGLVDAIVPSVGHANFEFLLTLLTAAAVAVSGRRSW